MKLFKMQRLLTLVLLCAAAAAQANWVIQTVDSEGYLGITPDGSGCKARADFGLSGFFLPLANSD